jgi:hypothetical protein
MIGDSTVDSIAQPSRRAVLAGARAAAAGGGGRASRPLKPVRITVTGKDIHLP